MLSGNFAEMMTSTPFRDLLHAANLRHGTDGFTSLAKEGVLRIFSPLKIRWLRLGTKGQHATPRPTRPLFNGIYLRTCPGCSVPEPYQSPDWALVSAQTGPRAEYL